MDKRRMIATGMIKKSNYVPELLIDGGFEITGTGNNRFQYWIQSGTEIGNETTVVYSGLHACKIPYITTANYVYQTFMVIPQKKYTATMACRGDGVNAGRYRLLDVTGSAYFIDYTSTGITENIYSKISFTFTTPANCVSARLYLYSHSAASTGVYFDEVSVKKNL